MRNLTSTVCVAGPPNPALSGAECSCVDSDVGNMWVAVRGSIYTVGLNKQVSNLPKHSRVRIHRYTGIHITGMCTVA